MNFKLNKKITYVNKPIISILDITDMNTKTGSFINDVRYLLESNYTTERKWYHPNP